jgi:flagellin
MGSSHVAAGPNGDGMELQMPNATLKALGIEDYDVSSGNFDISVIDDALDKVLSARSDLGASSNRWIMLWHIMPMHRII